MRHKKTVPRGCLQTLVSQGARIFGCPVPFFLKCLRHSGVKNGLFDKKSKKSSHLAALSAFGYAAAMEDK